VINFLNDKEMVKLSNELLKYIQQQQSEDFKFQFSRIKQKESKYEETIQMINDVLLKSPKNLEALKLKGHTHFLDKNIFDSDEAYINYLKNGGQTDFEVLERLGLVYSERKAWADAKVVFLKCVNENPSLTGWTNLAIACLRKGDKNECEDALM